MIDIDYQALPAISQLPEEGSVIAYKMVELDITMCPVVGFLTCKNKFPV